MHTIDQYMGPLLLKIQEMNCSKMHDFTFVQGQLLDFRNKLNLLFENTLFLSGLLQFQNGRGILLAKLCCSLLGEISFGQQF